MSKAYISSFIIAFMLILASTFYYLPYYVTKPGMAKELEPIIEVSNGDKQKAALC